MAVELLELRYQVEGDLPSGAAAWYAANVYGLFSTFGAPMSSNVMDRLS